jgi:hypothetical protein
LDKYKISNIVRVGNNQKLDIYISSIIIRMAPRIYNLPEHRCIKIQVMDSLLEFADTIVKRIKWAGLIETSRKKKELRNEIVGYNIPDGWEITLEKIPPLVMMKEDVDEEN